MISAVRNLFALALLFLPTAAMACPACLGSQKSFTPGLKALGAMILFPFGVAYLVVRAIRNANAESKREIE